MCFTFFLKGNIDLKASFTFSSSASTLNEQDTAKSNTSNYRSEHHLVDAARTRESYQDLASYFSEVDPNEPSTSATNTIVLSASTFDRERTEPSKTLWNSVLRCQFIYKIDIDRRT